ncbi:MAG: hypothetical protein Q4Q62_03785 [Thermoplasmata archaeon]|nr:hypothetical protein [Thermoplasmata archaeon]
MTGSGTFAAAVSVQDPVRDLMVLAVPGLEEDEQVCSVEPDELIPDDGCDGIFARLFEYDAMPVIAVEDPVRDLILLSVPSLSASEDWAPEAEVPEDCLDAMMVDAIDDDSAPRFVVPAGPVAIAPAPETALLAAPAESQEPEEMTAPVVTFSFGPQNSPERGWRVCFSF